MSFYRRRGRARPLQPANRGRDTAFCNGGHSAGTRYAGGSGFAELNLYNRPIVHTPPSSSGSRRIGLPSRQRWRRF